MNTKIQKLIPVLIIILGFFTLGISDIIWIYYISDKFDRKAFLPMKQLTLTVITFGIYGILWTRNISKEMYKSNILKSKSTVMLCTILSIIFLRTISIFVLYQAICETEAISVKESAK